MLAEAATHGIGIALIPRLLIEDELQRGILVEVAKHEHFSDRTYQLFYPDHKSSNAALAKFRDWIEEQARGYREPMGLA